MTIYMLGYGTYHHCLWDGQQRPGYISTMIGIVIDHPTMAPTMPPTDLPSALPTKAPISDPTTMAPTGFPSVLPTMTPTSYPTTTTLFQVLYQLHHLQFIPKFTVNMIVSIVFLHLSFFFINNVPLIYHFYFAKHVAISFFLFFMFCFILCFTILLGNYACFSFVFGFDMGHHINRKGK